MYTTLEQSKKLMKLGIEPKTADMHFFLDPSQNPKVDFGYSEENERFYKETQFKYLPCWSLTQLWNLIPKVNEEFPQFFKVQTTKGEIGFICYYENKEKEKGVNSGLWRTPIQAAIAMIEHLIENNLM